jgi:hypothetical protein
MRKEEGSVCVRALSGSGLVLARGAVVALALRGAARPRWAARDHEAASAAASKRDAQPATHAHFVLGRGLRGLRLSW